MTILYNKLKQYGIYTLMLGSLAACKKSDFASLNTDPEKLATVSPEGQFLNGIVNMHNGDFEYYYDFYREILPFSEMTVANGGNSQTFVEDNIGNANNRYGYYYSKVGNNFANIPHLIDAMSANEQAARVYEKAIPQILNVYYAWYVSDINGSIPYSEAFQARYTGNYTPKYDTQEELFTLWDSQLKAVVATLETTQSVAQTSYGANDLYYKGSVDNWIKCANSLRLKIASRLSKVAPEKFKSIANEVFADTKGTFGSVDDDLILIAGNTFTGGGNWNPVGLHASKSLVDFMLANADPRLRVFYAKNDYSKENFDAAVAQGVLPAGSTFKSNQYVGTYSSPDAVNAHPNYFKTRKISNGTGDVILDTTSLIQYRLFQAEYSYNNLLGSGFTSFPLLTYADICFIRSELALGGTGTDAEGWYYKGIEASIKRYDMMASTAKLPDYVAVTPAEITAYEASAGVKFDAANGLALIASQAFLNYYKTPNEAWAILKRLDMPNATTPLALEVLKASGVTQVIPRRASLNVLPETDRNAANNAAAIAEMAKNPDFGSGASDIFGRVWWDKK